MDQNGSLRAELDTLLSGQGTHAYFDGAFEGFQPELRRLSGAGSRGGAA